MHFTLKAVGLCTIFIFASRNQMMRAVDICTVRRDESGDIVRLNTNRSGFCPATDEICNALNAAMPSSSNSRGCYCHCSFDYATFLEGKNVCSENEHVNYDCRVYKKKHRKSDPLPVISVDTELELSLTTKRDTCSLMESLTKYLNASTWMSFPTGSFPLNLVSRPKGKGRRRKRNKYLYSVELLSTPEYLRGRLVKLVFSCGPRSRDRKCFMFKVEGKLHYATNICASSTVVMSTFSYSTNAVTSTADTATFTLQQEVRTSPTVAPTPLKSSQTLSVIVATETLLPSTITTRTSVLATNTHSPETKTLSKGMSESMITTSKQTNRLSTTTNGLFSTKTMSPLEPLTTYPSLNVKTKDFKVVVKKRQKVDDSNIWPIVGGVVGAVLLISIASVALVCFIRKRRQKGKQEGAADRGYQMQSAGVVNDAYSRGTESLHSVTEDRNITYQALSDQTNDEHNYQQLCNSSKSRLQQSDSIYSYPDNATLEGNESDEKMRKANGTTDADYCKIKANYFPQKNISKVTTSTNGYDYAAVEGKEFPKMKRVEDQIKREAKIIDEEDSPYYKVLESPDISLEKSASVTPNPSVIPNTAKEEPEKQTNIKKGQQKCNFHGCSPEYASLAKESDGSGYAELVRDTDSEGYLVPRDGKN